MLVPLRAQNDSAKGAQYESQGQVRSEAEHVAPGNRNKIYLSPEGTKYAGDYFGLSGLPLAFD